MEMFVIESEKDLIALRKFTNKVANLVSNAQSYSGEKVKLSASFSKHEGAYFYSVAVKSKTLEIATKYKPLN